MKFIPYILLTICFLLLTAFWWNRASPKIIETLVIIIAVMVSAIFYVARQEKVEKKINVLYLENQKKNELFFPLKDRFSIYYQHQYRFYYSYSKKKETVEYKNKLKSYDGKIMDRELTDLQVIALIDYMSMWMKKFWYTDKQTLLIPPFATAAGGGRLGDEDLLKDVIVYNNSKLGKIGFSDNIFWNAKSNEFEFTLPKDTTIKYKKNYTKAVSAQLIFQKNLFFTIKIQILIRMGAMGLGDIGHYLGITDISEEQSVSNPNIRDYLHHHVQLRCFADFNRFSAGHPKMRVYKEWTKRLFEELYKQFDWSVCYEGLKDRQQFLSGVKMLKEQGRESERGTSITN